MSRATIRLLTNQSHLQRLLQKGSQCLIQHPDSKTPQKLVQASIIAVTPFLRSNLPQPVPSQPFIPSLIPHRHIPTLFRIAEVHRLLARPPLVEPPERIEIYATVVSSRRGLHTKGQEFTFADLFFPNRPPYLCGTYTAWQLCELFDEDSAPFLDSAEWSKPCRAIVQITKTLQTGTSRRSESSPPVVNLGVAKEVEPKLMHSRLRY